MKNLFLAPVLCLLHHPLSASGTNLLNGLISTRTDVTKQMNVTLDIKDMLIAINKGDFDGAHDIYAQGKNSANYQLNELSRIALDGKFSDINPTFLFHTYGIAAGDAGTAMSYEEVLSYADDYIEDLLESADDANADKGRLACEAVSALSLWMYSVHELWESVTQCKEAELGGEYERGGVHSIDEAMAFWFGADDNPADDDGGGFSPFHLGEQTKEHFGQDGGVSVANQEIASLYEQQRTLLSTSDMCSAEGGGFSQEMYHLTNSMISKMTIPLVQKLISALAEDNKEKIQMYALAVVPQIIACKPSTARKLMSKLYYDYDYDKKDDFPNVIYMLQSSYDCLGITCADIGTYTWALNSVPECADPPNDLPLVSYGPRSKVRQNAKIDLDILQIKILTKMKAFAPAENIYNYGKNSLISSKKQNFRTLKSFSTYEKRKNEPYYEVFQDYYSDGNYADKTISRAFSGTGRFATVLSSDSQRAEIIAKTLSYQVMYAMALTEFYSAVEDCKNWSEDNVGDNHLASWDKGVAYLVGSIEGFQIGQAEVEDGVLLYNLANERCGTFATCDTNGISELIPILFDLFDEGMIGLDKKICGITSQALDKIKFIVLIPVIQSVIKNAIKESKLSVNSEKKAAAEGEAYTKAILPIIDYYDPDGAELISTNMVVVKDVTLVQNGPETVAQAFNKAVTEFGFDCSIVGFTEGIGVCPLGYKVPLEPAGSSGAVQAFGYFKGMMLIGTTVAALMLMS